MTDSGVAAAYSGEPESTEIEGVVETSTDAQIVPFLAPNSAGSVTSVIPTREASVADVASPTAKWIGLAGIAGIAGSLFLTYYGTFMVGLLALAATIAGIGFLRATLPRRAMAWFASRNRVLDCTLYFGFALVLLALAVGIPQ